MNVKNKINIAEKIGESVAEPAHTNPFEIFCMCVLVLILISLSPAVSV